MNSLDQNDLVEALQPWLENKIEGGSDLAIRNIRSAKAGTSAETLHLDINYRKSRKLIDQSFVLRRQMAGSDLILNADLSWQWQTMKEVSRLAGPPVPPLVGLEEDSSILGSPFLVMHEVRGHIVRQSPNYHLEGWLADQPISFRETVWNNAIDAIATINSTGVSDAFGFLITGNERPGIDSYLAYLERWYDWAAAGREQPVADKALKYLKQNKPQRSDFALLWGDAILANMIFAPTGKVAAVLDWEMAALGPAEMDLAWWLFFDDMFSAGSGVPRLPGFPDRAATIRRYEQGLGREVANMDYFEILSMVKLGIILVRQFDRRMKLGKLSPGSLAYLHNPIMAMTARRLGIPEPEVGSDYAEMRAAAGEV